MVKNILNICLFVLTEFTNIIDRCDKMKAYRRTLFVSRLAGVSVYLDIVLCIVQPIFD